MGAKTLLLTQSLDTIGQMSCNPAIGGIGKSHLVREIDALGGIMAQAADRAGIQFRVLNRSKGPAVRATRVQADRGLYRQSVRQLLDGLEDLHLFQQSVTDLLVEDGVLKGVVTQMGLEFYAPAVVMTTGTFLSGRIHIGQENFAGGRAGDAPSNALARKLRDRGLRVGRLKTGTPPRIDGRSVDYSVMEEQRGDEPLPCLSFLGEPSEHPEQRSCFITHTNEQTHELIRGALDRSPMFSGAIEGVGPRYCPSIEDKVVRFADRVAHQIFVEPEGLLTNELYPNGISTSLPFDVQIHAVRSIKGFENAHITRPGYAIEYDYYDPRELQYSLETKALDGLFFAGQINGTTGYEEAAAQGLLAGTNAALKVSGKQTWCPRRDEAYIGVLVDDLINLGTNEPYRMFTSRAEYRLRLREDNADQRLTPVGRELGLVSGLRWERFTQKRDAVDELRRALEAVAVAQTSSLARDLSRELGEEITKDTTLVGVLRRPRATLDALADCVKPYLSQSAAEALASAEIASQVEVEVKYEGYIKRQEDEIAKVRRHERIRLPESIDFASLPGLSNELKVKLMEVQPPTLARAARIPGMTAAGLSILLVHARKHDERAGAGARG
tara:strand:+ start:11458 stop:13293 length:1836 start_codon:yes stop_codon:yes gene_type:complete